MKHRDDMFNLGHAIGEWRRQMLGAGIRTPVPLDELESHLRDEIEQQMRAGLSPQQSFDAAVQRIGQAHALKTEFAKTRKTRRAMQNVMRLICALLLLLIVSLSGFTFFQMQLSLAEQILAGTGIAFTLAVACAWRYAVPFLPIISGNRTRIGVGLACIVSGFLCTSFFANVILPHFEQNHDHQLPAVGFWAVLPIAVFLSLGVGLMTTARDRERWGIQNHGP